MKRVLDEEMWGTPRGVAKSSIGACQLVEKCSLAACAIRAIVFGLELAFQVDMRDKLSLIAFVILHFVLHVGSRSRAWIGMGLPS